MQSKNIRRVAAVALMAGVASTAQAHTDARQRGPTTSSSSSQRGDRGAIQARIMLGPRPWPEARTTRPSKPHSRHHQPAHG